MAYDSITNGKPKGGIEMSEAYILNMAMHELLRKREREQERFDRTPGNFISEARLQRYDKEIKELHEMILKAERNEAV